MVTLQLSGLSKTYAGAINVHALQNATVTIRQGEYVVIEGPSGSGKSTLLNQIALLDTPTAGSYIIDEVNTTTLSDLERAQLRSSTFSFIFQSFHLLDGRSVLDNVALGTLYRGLPTARRRELAAEALGIVGLEHKATQKAATLSGGERQRVAIARAIAAGSPILVADEPTGNLDQANGQQVMDTLEALNARGTTVIVVTHDPTVAARAPRRLHVLDGVLEDRSYLSEERRKTILASSPDGDVGAENASAPSQARKVPAPEGRSSTVRLVDALADAWKGLWAKPSRTIALITSVALGVGLALTTTGLAQSAQYQVSDIFDAQRNQRVTMTISRPQTTPGREHVTSAASLTRVLALAGVEEALIAVSHDQHRVATTPQGAADMDSHARYDVVGIVDGELPTSILNIDTAGLHVPTLKAGEVIVGAQVAQEIQLGPLLGSPAVWVDGRPLRVVGVLNDAGLQIGLLRSILMHESEAASLSAIRYTNAEIKVLPGAAPQVAQQGPIAWLPADPESVIVNAPPDPTTLRDSIESNLQTMLITLTGVALLAAVLSMTNAMTSAVFQRVGEFGLRRAIGARRLHVIGVVLSESIAIGVVGGIVGIYASIMVILGVTLFRQWQPVLDPVMIPIGLCGGMVVGLIGGVVATHRAARIEPSDALRA